MIEIVHAKAGFLSCRIVLETSERGVTRTGKLTDGSIREVRFVSRLAKNSRLSPYATFVTHALTSWAEGDERALDGIGVQYQGTEFQTDVLRALRNVEYGSTASYQDLAVGSGYPKAHRAVASVCAKNRIPLILPCHRIIKSDGTLGNYYYGTDLKRKMLAIESG